MMKPCCSRWRFLDFVITGNAQAPGFRELDARRALEEARADVPSGAEPTAEQLLRAALARLRTQARG